MLLLGGGEREMIKKQTHVIHTLLIPPHLTCILSSTHTLQVRIDLSRSHEGLGTDTPSTPSSSSSSGSTTAAAQVLSHTAPLHVRLSVPLWLLNYTGLPVSAGLVPLAVDEAERVLDSFFEPLDQGAGGRAFSVMAKPVAGGDDPTAGAGEAENRQTGVQGTSDVWACVVRQRRGFVMTGFKDRSTGARWWHG